jgi:UDP-glucose 4-epimerase
LFRSRTIDAVMHFAALIEAGESMKAPETFFPQQHRECADPARSDARRRSQAFRFLVDGGALWQSRAHSDRGGRSPPPTNAYGESKLLVERMLAWFHQIHGLRYASLRYFNAAGASRPDQGEAHQPETHLIPRILEVALGRAPST